MIRSFFRRAPRMERLESRQVLSNGGPSAQAQYMLEVINHARINPPEVADRVTSNLSPDVLATLSYYNVNLPAAKSAIASAPPKPPLAWNDQLAQTAQGQSQDQVNMGVQTHTGADGSSLETRLDRVGYTNRTSDGENAYAYSTSVDQAMEAFLIDWGVSSLGHRTNLLQQNTSDENAYREVGIGMVQTNKPEFGPEVITQDFGSRVGAKAELLGVVYDDPNHTHFYAPGEGRGGVEIDATNLNTGAVSSTQTWDSGGYQLALDPGLYSVSARVGNNLIRSQDVRIGTQNVKVDYDLGDSQPSSNSNGGSASVKVQPPVVKPANVSPTYDPSWFTSWTSWKAYRV